MLNSEFIQTQIQSIIHFSDELLFPQFCNTCENKLNDKELILCKNCISEFQFIINYNRTEELKFAEFLDFSFSAYWFNDNLKNCMHALKYQGFTNLVQYLLAPSFSYLKSIIQKYSIDFIVPVPLHNVKKRERGFNQANIICTILSSKFNTPTMDCLNREVWTESQTTLSISDRKKNIQDAFSIKQKIQNANYLIIDDVLTTGSTANECAKIIKENSTSKVGVFTICAAE